MNKNGEEEENRPHKIVRKKEEEDEHRDVTNQFNKNMSSWYPHPPTINRSSTA